jgi:hypothetical protein
MSVQDDAVPFREGDDDRPLAAIDWGYGADETSTPQTLRIAVPDVARATVVIAAIVSRDDPKRADRGQCWDLGSGQVIVPVLRDVDPLMLQSAGQVQVAGEDVAGLDRVGPAAIQRLTIPAVGRTRIKATEHRSASHRPELRR